jgi:hypothetical protein
MHKRKLVKTNKVVTVIVPHLDEAGTPSWTALRFASEQGVCRRAIKRGIRRAFGRAHCKYLEEVIKRYAIIGEAGVSKVSTPLS